MLLFQSQYELQGTSYFILNIKTSTKYKIILFSLG